MAATDNDALLKAMDQLMKEEDRASVIEYAKQLSTKGGDVVGTMRKMSQQGVDTKKDAAMWKKRALLTAAVAVVVCAVMFGLMIASAELSKESHVFGEIPRTDSGRQLNANAGAKAAVAKDDGTVVNGGLLAGWELINGIPTYVGTRRLTAADAVEHARKSAEWTKVAVGGQVGSRRLGDGRELSLVEGDGLSIFNTGKTELLLTRRLDGEDGEDRELGNVEIVTGLEDPAHPDACLVQAAGRVDVYEVCTTRVLYRSLGDGNTVAEGYGPCDCWGSDTDCAKKYIAAGKVPRTCD